MHMTITVTVDVPVGLPIPHAKHDDRDPNDIEYGVHRITNVLNLVKRGLSSSGIEVKSIQATNYQGEPL
jgi:hypothetical protein